MYRQCIVCIAAVLVGLLLTILLMLLFSDFTLTV